MEEREQAAQLRRAARGDANGLQRLIVFHHPMLRRLVEQRIPPELRRHIDPDDILQQAYVTTFQHMKECEFANPAAFAGWLQRVALSRLADVQRALRRQKRDVTREAHDSSRMSRSFPDLAQQLVGDDITPSRHLAHDEIVAAMLACMARLSEDQRTVIQLRFLEGWSVPDVAERMQRDVAAVHSLCHRGLQKLRLHLSALSDHFSKS